MKQTFLLGVILAVPFVVSAQTATTASTPASTATTPVSLQDPGLVPGDFFYFLDQWGEGFRSLLAFSAESKIKLSLQYAKERAAEVHAVIVERGIGAPEAKEARDLFGEEVARAASVVAGEKAKGLDVSVLAKEANDEIELSKEMLKEAYRGYHDELKSKEKDIQDKLKEAIARGDTALQVELNAELQGVAEDSLLTLDEEGMVEDDFDDEKMTLEEAMGAERAAEAHIENIDRKFEQAKRAAAEKGVILDATLMAEYQSLNAKADEAFKAGDFDAAKTYAKEAQNVLHDAEQGIDTKDLEKEFFGDMDGMDMGEGMEEDMMDDGDVQTGMPVPGERGVREMEVDRR